MIRSTGDSSGEAGTSGRAGITRWSLVLAGGRPEVGTSSLDVAALCERSMFPAYAWWRASGMESAMASRAAMVFLRELSLRASRDTLLLAPRNFRLFLHEVLASRPAMVVTTAGDDAEAAVWEARFHSEAGASCPPRDAFDRAYANDLIKRAHDRLAIEATQTRRERLFSSLDPHLAKDPPQMVLEALALEHGMRPVLIAHALERLRQRFRELVDAEVADTVVDSDELAVERRALLMILSNRH